MLQVPLTRHLGSSELIHRKALEWKDSSAFISRSDSPLAQNILQKVTDNHNMLRSNFRGIQAFSPFPTVFSVSTKIANHVARVSRGAAVAH
jgi:hypothetical protein